LILLARDVLLIKKNEIKLINKIYNFVFLTMILFLDTISPLPEFSLIEDNKIIFSKKIVTNLQNKMSDAIIPTYLKIEKKFSLTNKLKYLVTNTGPGSYTALRIGISFLSGLSISQNINLIGLSAIELFNYSINKKKLDTTALFINSSNNQNFLCLYDVDKKKYSIDKVQKDIDIIKLEKLSIHTIISNSENDFFNLDILNKIKYKKISFKKIVNENINDILFIPKKEIIEPIYISDNKILN
tara:strand:+ start:43 stop:768 length:726 start_codon:yes stop_codon:yes gene_type:complete